MYNTIGTTVMIPKCSSLCQIYCAPKIRCTGIGSCVIQLVITSTEDLSKPWIFDGRNARKIEANEALLKLPLCTRNLAILRYVVGMS